jgi:hypothetical protein
LAKVRCRTIVSYGISNRIYKSADFSNPAAARLHRVAFLARIENQLILLKEVCEGYRVQVLGSDFFYLPPCSGHSRRKRQARQFSTTFCTFLNIPLSKTNSFALVGDVEWVYITLKQTVMLFGINIAHKSPNQSPKWIFLCTGTTNSLLWAC